jgi:hypothetical protein
MTEVEALLSENAAQRRQIAELIDQIAKLNERVGELLAVAQRKPRKPPAERPPVPPPVVASGVRSRPRPADR